MELFESPGLIPLDLCLWGLTKSKVYKTKDLASDSNLMHNILFR